MRLCKGHVALLSMAMVILAGCGGGGGSNNPPAGTQTGSVRGTVLAPDGHTPIAGATVSTTTRASGRATLSTTSAVDGTFTLANVPVGAATLSVTKGQWTRSFQVTVTANQTVAAPASSTTLPGTRTNGAPKLAVVTGMFDTMQDVLAKIGMGTIDNYGHLVVGTEQFDLYNGDGSLPGTYPTMQTLLNDPSRMAQYKIIFLNCGVDEDLLSQTAVLTNLRNYVNNGGILYVTDYAYDYVEQVFPDAIRFANGTGADNQPETIDAAQIAGDASADGTVLDPTVRSWLQARSALSQLGGTLPIVGIWTVMDTLPSTTHCWVQGTMSGITGVKPLTVTFSRGQGKVLYSSYHTAEVASPQLQPQEYLLVYVLFEL